ncbi:MAG: DUF2304 domain-containing protein [Desulfatirhabdiaceae bacterium]|nr:DUF2304 domain-containing protein [Desulfatirhabdiaceae bacterium]
MIFLSAHLTSLGIGIAIALAILILVRKNHMMVSHAIWWLMVALASITFGAFPWLIDRIGVVLGIHYPPILLMVIGLGLILIKMLTMDLKRSDQERNIRALTQRLAILESEMYPHVESRRNSAASSDPSVNFLEAPIREKVGQNNDRE